MDYKLSSVIFAHTSDVRCLDILPDGKLLSGSRDATAKLWKSDGSNSFENAVTYHGHRNFIFSVCALPQTSCYPWGLIVTGSNDNTICGYVPDEGNPIFKFTGHSDTVCDLKPALRAGFFSASWDKTAKFWDITLKECKVTYKGHTMAVWCVLQLPVGNVVTGSADQSIRIYNEFGEHIRTLNGHKDCVRGFQHMKDSEFLSCSNDGSIRHWDGLNGICLEEFDCHPNYIYSICISPNGFIASGGEDNYVHIRLGNCSQNIILPAQSVWAVKFLPNNDLATACSDGTIRIFTTDPTREADSDVMNTFNEEVNHVLQNREIGGIKMSELPGPDALLQAGTKDGQIKMVREPSGVICYKWSSRKTTWEKIGDVMGGVGGTQKTSGKKLYNGKEYDYVFDVEIEDGKPPLKLPYNLKDNPSQSAHDFLIRNNLSIPLYLEQVTNFILQNCPQNNSFIVPYCDPYTGSTRYVPTGVSCGSTENSAVTNNPTNSDSKQELSKQTYFPQKQFLCFDIGDPTVIIKKLLEFNSQQGDGAVVDNAIANLEKMMSANIDHSYNFNNEIEILCKLLQWDKDFLFPVIDVIRLAVRDEVLNSLMCHNERGEMILELALKLLEEESLIPNQITSVRLLTNLLLHSKGKELVLNHRNTIIEKLIKLSKVTAKKHLQIGISTLSLNFAVALQNSEGCSNDYTSLPMIFSKIVCSTNDSEALFRSLVALGTLLSHKPKPVELSSELLPFLVLISENKIRPSKVINCSDALLALLMSDMDNNEVLLTT